MNCGTKVSLNYTILLKNKTLHKLSTSLKHVCHMGCAYPGKEADWTLMATDGNQSSSEGIQSDLGAPNSISSEWCQCLTDSVQSWVRRCEVCCFGLSSLLCRQREERQVTGLKSVNQEQSVQGWGSVYAGIRTETPLPRFSWSPNWASQAAST